MDAAANASAINDTNASAINDINYIYYEFRPHDRRMPSAVTAWRTALDNIGLEHVKLPEISYCLTHWGVFIDPEILEGKKEELAQQLAAQVAQRQLRYLELHEYEGFNPDGTRFLKDYREYTSGGVSWMI
jgi:hypothetical protein